MGLSETDLPTVQAEVALVQRAFYFLLQQPQPKLVLQLAFGLLSRRYSEKQLKFLELGSPKLNQLDDQKCPQTYVLWWLAVRFPSWRD